MATISAADLTKLRTQQQKLNLYLSVLQPDSLLTAQVNNGAIARGDRAIAYDTGGGTGFANIVTGHTLWIGTAAGTYDVGKLRIKSIAGNQAAGTITVDENGIDWVDDLYLTIKEEFLIWPILPRISGGIFYKFYSTTYVDQNEEPNPVALMGPHRAGFLSSGSVTFDLDGSSSYVTASGAAISNYAWTSTGGAIANAAIATTTITFNATGYYWVTLTVTDDNGKTQATHRCFFVHNPTGAGAPYRNFSVSGFAGDWNAGGWQYTIDAHGDVTLSDFPDDALCVLWHDSYFDNSETYVNLWGLANEVICNGYIYRDSDSDDLDSGDGTVSFNVITPEGILARRTEMGTVTIEAVSTPQYWYEYASWLTAGRAVHHLLKWHSTTFETCDVIDLLDNTLGVERVQFIENSLLARVNGFALDRGIFAKLMSDRLGRLHFVEYSQMFNDTDRAALDTVFTLTENDISGDISFPREATKQVALDFLDGFSFDGTTATALIAIYGGYIDVNSIQTPELDGGTGVINKPRQILADQTDANEKAGRLIAVANNPYPQIPLTMRGNYLGAFDIVPSIGWYKWGLANATLKRNLSLNGKNLLCQRININFPTGSEVYGGDIQITVTFEMEATGPDGIPGDQYPTSYPTPVLPTPNWTPITGDSAVIAYADSSDGNKGKAAVLVKGSVTIGTPAQFEAGDTSVLGVCGISSTKAVVLYNDNGDSGIAKACVLSVSGTTITPGTPVNVNGSSFTLGGNIAGLSATQAIAVFNEGGNGKAIILDIAGAVITPGGERLITGNSAAHTAVCRMASNQALMTYSDVDLGDIGQVVILDIGAGPLITPGAIATFTNGKDSFDTAPIFLDTDKAVVVFQEDDTNNNISAAFLSISGNTITPTAPVEINSGVVDAVLSVQGKNFATRLSATQFVSIHTKATGANGVGAVVCNVSGMVITPGTPVTLATGLGSNSVLACCMTASGSSVMYAYRDNGPTYVASAEISDTSIIGNGDDTTSFSTPGVASGHYIAIARLTSL